MSNELAPVDQLIKDGYTKEEANALVTYRERGLPGVSKLRADAFESLYIMGYTCKDIHDQFPEYELGLIVYARQKFKWDEKRANYQANLAAQVIQAAALAKAESVRFLYDVLSAVHAKNRNEIMRYLANPDKEKAPDFLPKSLGGYQTLINMINDLTAPPAAAKGGANDPANVASPLVNITLNNGPAASSKPVIDVTPKAVGDALIQEMKNKDKKDE